MGFYDSMSREQLEQALASLAGGSVRPLMEGLKQATSSLNRVQKKYQATDYRVTDAIRVSGALSRDTRACPFPRSYARCHH